MAAMFVGGSKFHTQYLKRVTHVFQRIKISRTNFEKGHTGNNSVKLFQNRTSGFL